MSKFHEAVPVVVVSTADIAPTVDPVQELVVVEAVVTMAVESVVMPLSFSSSQSDRSITVDKTPDNGFAIS